MTAGVQNFDPAAYLPPPPGTPESKGTGAEDKRTADSKGQPSDFQSEMERHEAKRHDAEHNENGAQKTKSSAHRETGAEKPRNDKSGSDKPENDKPGKKRDAHPEDGNASAVLPPQVPEAQKQILALVLAFAQPDENVDSDGQAPSDEHPQDPARPVGQGTDLRVDARVAPIDRSPSADASQMPEVRIALPDTQYFSNTPTNGEEKDPTGGRSEASAQPGISPPSMSPSSQPASRDDLKLADLARPEPAAAAIQETVDSVPSSPSALAFAARLAAMPEKSEESAPDNPPQPAVAGSQASPRIPLRYAATAQILQDAGAGTKPGFKKDLNAALDRPVRTDTVLPRFEAAREAAPDSRPAAPQHVPSSARLDRIIEPPAAPPTSSHDIRVRVPDNNGGSTQVRFVESGGEVRVSVRTADAGLAQNLRSHLNDLTQQLADGGLPAEFWKPGASASSSQNDHHQPDREGRGPGGQGSGAREEQQHREEKRPAWLEEMEASLKDAKK